MTITIEAQPGSEVLTNKLIVDMHKGGLSKEIVISKIETSNCKFDLSTTALIALKKQGIPDDIINAMVNKGSKKNSIPKTEQINNKSAGKIKIELLNYVHTYYHDTIMPLEKALANVKTKSKVLGYGGTNFVLEVNDETSPVKISSVNTSTFIIKTGTETAPDIVLYKLKVSNKKRHAVTSKFTLGGMQGSEGAITVNVSKVEPGIFKIILSPLEKGEYFFINRAVSNAGTNSEVFAFSVIP